MLTPEQEAALLDFSPMTTQDGEPVGIFDWSPSMLQWNDAAHTITKIDLLRAAFPVFVHRLAGLDAQGKKEEGGGGLMSWGFANTVIKLGDVNDSNLSSILAKIQAQGNATYAGLALDTALDAAIDEEDLDPTKPIVMLLGTDGEAHDADRVRAFMDKKVRGRVRLAVGVFGYGDEHDDVVKQYLGIQDEDPAHKTHMRVVSFSKMTTGEQLADAALSLFGV